MTPYDVYEIYVYMQDVVTNLVQRGNSSGQLGQYHDC